MMLIVLLYLKLLMVQTQHYKIVFGIILGSGCGGGLVIDKKILVGPNAFAGEWGHVPIGKSKKDHNIEEFISGKV